MKHNTIVRKHSSFGAITITPPSSQQQEATAPTTTTKATQALETHRHYGKHSEH